MSVDRPKMISLLRQLIADLEAEGGAPAAPAAKPAPARPAGGDGWQRCLATYWSCEMKQTSKGEQLRGRIGVSWKDADGNAQKAFYPVFDAALCEKIEEQFEKGGPIRIMLRPWKDTAIVSDFLSSRDVRGGE
jgi:hypothetical protein